MPILNIIQEVIMEQQEQILENKVIGDSMKALEELRRKAAKNRDWKSYEQADRAWFDLWGLGVYLDLKSDRP